MNALAYLILVNGKHLELIKIFEEYQSKSVVLPEDSKNFLLGVETFLTSEGKIGTRKPTAVTTAAKVTYIRDEPKLWNKFQIMKLANKKFIFL